ncbi:ABC transporter permease [Streptomyces kaniharaensis]|uniref:ABC transporter permease n=1 Tax=Streptomyces kaniharaensis TaxID=212423 RepID=A0A6N7KKP9_9ACTN|nr:ABC transporter permease [Streptomyces kaniharaensis]MQS10917.1 ABC transporter permease [Streptomyces kaniharaensis]
MPFQQPSPPRPRFWLETALGSLSGLLFLITLAWPEWIETLLGVDPDAGSGVAEWLVAALAASVTAACALAARIEWRRTHSSSAHATK